MYVDREGNAISKQRWETLRKSEDYTKLATFDAFGLCVSLEWRGVVERPNEHRNKWTTFRVVAAVRSRGALIPLEGVSFELRGGYPDEVTAWMAYRALIRDRLPKVALGEWEETGCGSFKGKEEDYPLVPEHFFGKQPDRLRENEPELPTPKVRPLPVEDFYGERMGEWA